MTANWMDTIIFKHPNTPAGHAELADIVGYISANILFHESNPCWTVRTMRALQGEWVCAARTDRGDVWLVHTGQVGLPFNDREAEADASETFRLERQRTYALEHTPTPRLDWQRMPVALAVELPDYDEVLFYQCGPDEPLESE